MIGWKVVEDGLWEVFVVNVVLEEETLGAHLYVRVLTEAADDGTGWWVGRLPGLQSSVHEFIV